jgi:uncharacterized membrane protein YdfJ with MMPL/SSD domain
LRNKFLPVLSVLLNLDAASTIVSVVKFRLDSFSLFALSLLLVLVASCSFDSGIGNGIAKQFIPIPQRRITALI